MACLGLLIVPAFGAQLAHADNVQLNKAQCDRVAAKYSKIMADEYNEILQGFFALCAGVSAAEWNAHVASCLPWYVRQEQAEIQQLKQRQSAPLRADTIALCNKVLQQASICRPVQIVSDAQTLNDIYAARSSIMIREQQFDVLYPYEEFKEATLWHEMQHLKFEDTFIGFCINQLYNKHAARVYNVPAWNKLVHRWDHFIERRADILGALAQPSLIKARAESLKYLTCCDTSADAGHPSIESRYAMMAQLEREIHG